MAASNSHRQRVPAAERRDALIDAAIEEFAHGGLHGTPVDRIARRVGVAQPYVFSLFADQARPVHRGGRARALSASTTAFTERPRDFEPAIADCPRRGAAGDRRGYIELLESDRTVLMLQLQAYAARATTRDPRAGAGCLRPAARPCASESVRRRRRDELDEFLRYGMWLNVQAAMGVEDLEEAVRVDAGDSREARKRTRRDRRGSRVDYAERHV